MKREKDVKEQKLSLQFRRLSSGMRILPAKCEVMSRLRKNYSFVYTAKRLKLLGQPTEA